MDWCWSWSSNTLWPKYWCKELTHWKRPWCWERLRAGGEGGDRGWDGWMASLTGWTWVWASSRSWWQTGNTGMLQSMGLQRVRHDWATGTTICVHGTEQIPLLKCPFYPRHRVNAVPPKFPMIVFTESANPPNICVNHKGPQIAKVTLRKNRL